MKILLTGSGGADGVPGFFANSRVSQYAREHGGKDVRLRAGALIDGDLKIDFGPDTYAQCCALGLRAADWKHILFTHSHFDHYAPKLMQYAFPPFTDEGFRPAGVFGNANIIAGFDGAFDLSDKIERRQISSFETAQIGDYTVTPIRAYHKLDEDSLNLIIEKGGKALLYAVDTGIYQDETWSFLAGRKLDALVIECSEGFQTTDYWGHLSCEQLLGVLDKMRALGCLSDDTVVCTTHHSHTGNGTHDELEAFFMPKGIEVGFDGKSIEI